MYYFQFKTKGGSQVKQYCDLLTKEDCRRQTGSFVACNKVNDKNDNFFFDNDKNNILLLVILFLWFHF